ncbi:MAG: DegV family protein [Anaerolineae bacterium]
MRVRIVTDSSARVPDGYLERLGIVEVLAALHFGQESYLSKQLAADEFYRRLAVAPAPPTTSQPTPQQFAEAYARLVAEGAEAIVAVCMSGALSGTLNSAVLAAEHAGVPVYIWDTQHVSMAAGWQAIYAAELALAGATADAILAGLGQMRARMQMYFTPANLRYLVASGRAPRLRGTLGDVLNIKPILATVEGRLEPVGQVRGQQRALDLMLDRVAAALGGRPARVAVGHCNVPELGSFYMAAVQARLHVVEGVVFELGPVLAALGGPGLIGLAAYALAA